MKPTSFADLRVLIVEDEFFISGLIKRMLRILAVSDIQEAADGTEALFRLEGLYFPHLIICDVQMKPMDGLTFLAHLRAMTDPARAKLPVIMLTSIAHEATIRDTKGLGVSNYLLKPISLRQLSERMSAIFRF